MPVLLVVAVVVLAGDFLLSVSWLLLIFHLGDPEAPLPLVWTVDESKNRLFI